MPCLGPLTLKEQMQLIARLAVSRRRARLACTVAVAALLLGPSAVHRARHHSPATFAAVAPCPEPAPDFMADLDGGVGQGPFLPKKFPRDWRREPCPKDPRVRVISDEDGEKRCFLAFGKPPCGVGFEHNGECVVVGGTGKGTPSSLGR